MVISMIVLEISEQLLVSLVSYLKLIFATICVTHSLFCLIAVIWDHDTNDWMVNQKKKKPPHLYLAYILTCPYLFYSLLKKFLALNLNGLMVTLLNGLAKQILLLVVFL